MSSDEESGPAAPPRGLSRRPRSRRPGGPGGRPGSARSVAGRARKSPSARDYLESLIAGGAHWGDLERAAAALVRSRDLTVAEFAALRRPRGVS